MVLAAQYDQVHIIEWQPSWVIVPSPFIRIRHPHCQYAPLVQDITLINPMRYFMVILRGVFLEDMPFHRLLSQYWPMAVIGVCTLGFAGWLFRHRMY